MKTIEINVDIVFEDLRFKMDRDLKLKVLSIFDFFDINSYLVINNGLIRYKSSHRVSSSTFNVSNALKILGYKAKFKFNINQDNDIFRPNFLSKNNIDDFNFNSWSKDDLDILYAKDKQLYMLYICSNITPTSHMFKPEHSPKLVDDCYFKEYNTKVHQLYTWQSLLFVEFNNFFSNDAELYEVNIGGRSEDEGYTLIALDNGKAYIFPFTYEENIVIDDLEVYHDISSRDNLLKFINDKIKYLIDKYRDEYEDDYTSPDDEDSEYKLLFNLYYSGIFDINKDDRVLKLTSVNHTYCYMSESEYNNILSQYK